MQSQNLSSNTAQIICQVTEASLFRLHLNIRERLDTGTLQLAFLNTEKVYFLNLMEYCHNLFPETPIVIRTSEDGMTFLLPHQESGLTAIFIHASDAAKHFYENVSKIVQLIPLEIAMKDPQFRVMIEYHCKDLETHPIEKEKHIEDYIMKAGESIKKGFHWLGELLAPIEKKLHLTKGKKDITGSENIPPKDMTETQQQSNVQKMVQEPHEEKQVQQSTMEKHEPIPERMTLELTEKMLKMLFVEVLEQMVETEQKKMKELRRPTWDLILSGLGQILRIMGDQLSETNTTQSVEQRYGQDLTNIFMMDKEKQMHHVNQ